MLLKIYVGLKIKHLKGTLGKATFEFKKRL